MTTRTDGPGRDDGSIGRWDSHAPSPDHRGIDHPLQPIGRRHHNSRYRTAKNVTAGRSEPDLRPRAPGHNHCIAIAHRVSPPRPIPAIAAHVPLSILEFALPSILFIARTLNSQPIMPIRI